MRINRRELLTGAAALSLAGTNLRAEPVLTDDGLYKEPWYLESFLDLAEDLDGARKQGKRFVIAWELRGCPYCKETHFVNLAQPRISDYIRNNFEVLQLNIIGSRKVTDFDGKEISEKELARKYDVRFTPTFQFFADNADALKTEPPRKREITRAAGYMQPDDFLAMFRYVREKAYEGKSFKEFLKSLPS